MKILSMFRYGSHYKVDGPPVNIPATIDKICKILPRIPDEAEVYPMKLKRKLKYKGNYMYNTIRKDVVMNALRWLKNNNDYYKDVEMNDIWDEHWKNDELGSLLDANTDMEGSIIDESDISGFISFSFENETATEKIIRLQDEKEMKEDQLAADKNAEINGQSHSCTMQLDHIEDGVYSVAPGEDNLPKYVLLDKDFEVLAFRDLFPLGKTGFDSVGQRITKLSLRKYFQQRLLNVDGCFAKNIEYLFCAQYAADLKQIQSAADLHWPEMIQAVGIQLGKRFSKEDVLNMTWKEKSDYLKNNPVTGVRMFQNRVNSFLTEYVYSDQNPLGEVTDHVIKIEFQARGSPHAHCLLWVKGAPKINIDSDEAVCQFIDQYITGVVPPNCNENKEIRDVI